VFTFSPSAEEARLRSKHKKGTGLRAAFDSINERIAPGAGKRV
jgi:hypothetical protein